MSLLLAEKLICTLMSPLGLDEDDGINWKCFIKTFPLTHP